MASAKNRRTSPYINGNPTTQSPQPMNRPLSASQRMSQIQGNTTKRGQVPQLRGQVRGTPPPPIPTRGMPPPTPVSRQNQEKSPNNINDNRRRELSIPEAFAMLNRKVKNLEEIMNINGIELDSFNTSSGNIDDKLILLRHEMEDIISERSPNVSDILTQMNVIKEEKDNEIIQLILTIDELTNELKDFKSRFDCEELSTTGLMYDDGELSSLIDDENTGENVEMEISEKSVIHNSDEEEISDEGEKEIRNDEGSEGEKETEIEKVTEGENLSQTVTE
jgi:hypothetical protein